MSFGYSADKQREGYKPILSLVVYLSRVQAPLRQYVAPGAPSHCYSSRAIHQDRSQGPDSSAGQSVRLLRGKSQVRILLGALILIVNQWDRANEGIWEMAELGNRLVLLDEWTDC